MDSSQENLLKADTTANNIRFRLQIPGKASSSNSLLPDRRRVMRKAVNSLIDLNDLSYFRVPILPELMEETQSSIVPEQFSHLVGRLPDILYNQKESRYVQRVIDTYSGDIEGMLNFLRLLLPDAEDIICNTFGNYVFQSLIELKSDEINQVLYTYVFESNLIKFSEGLYSSRVLQKAIDLFPTDLKQKIADGFVGKVKQVSTTEHGHHIIKKLIKHSDKLRLSFITDELVADLDEISMDKYGFSVVQKAIFNKGIPKKDYLIRKILKRTMDYALHKNANFVIQEIIKTRNREYINEISERFRGHVLESAKSRYASNVLELLLRQRSPAVINLVFEEITYKDSVFLEVINGPFSNYVVQTFLRVTRNERHRNKVMEIMDKHKETILEMKYGRYVYQKYSEKL